MMFEDNDELQRNQNPCSTPFSELKTNMMEIDEGIHKKIQKKPAENAKPIDLKRSRVIYHRNFFFENEDHPFDSTYLNGRPDEICMALDNGKTVYVDGLLGALESMKEGEESMFIINYKRMYGELGCPPRVMISIFLIRTLLTIASLFLVETKSRRSLCN